MYSMKEACEQTGLTYETLKFYCNQGLVPNVKRDSHRRRVFDDDDIAWIHGLCCLRNCEMGIRDMKEYLSLCQEGSTSIPKRKGILDRQKELLLKCIQDLQAAINYIERKKQYYDDIEQGKVCEPVKWNDRAGHLSPGT